MLPCFRVLAIFCALLFVVSGPVHQALAACESACVEECGPHSDDGQDSCVCACHFGNSATTCVALVIPQCSVMLLAEYAERTGRPAEAPWRGIEHPPQRS